MPRHWRERAGSDGDRACCRWPASTPQPRSREHTLLSTILGDAWRDGRDLDLASLIQQVQTPPFQKVGVVDLESFFPAKDRFDARDAAQRPAGRAGIRAVAAKASRSIPPACSTRAEGKPRVAIFSIAHLGDAERMFFVVAAAQPGRRRGCERRPARRACARSSTWTRSSATSRRSPNPPSKGPLLTLLKQGRAFGVGVVLATQNPVDLDYKGLANIGTWFLGRLQTERDKARDARRPRGRGGRDASIAATADRLLSALDKRVFLLHDVHDDAPVVFQTPLDALVPARSASRAIRSRC